MVQARFDWVELAERAYDVRSSEREWLESIARCLRPALDCGHGLMGGVTEKRDGKFVPRTEFTMDAPRLSLKVSHLSWKMAPKTTEKFFATQGRINSSELYPGASPLLAGLARRIGLTLVDTACFVAPDGQGTALGVAAPRPERGTPMSPRTRRPWKAAAQHVGAALRLRMNLKSHSLSDPRIGALFDERGRLEHAIASPNEQGDITGLSALVQRKKTISESPDLRARDDSLELWPALYSGRWSLVDRSDTDGKRFVVAYRNEIEGGDPRQLSYRERQIAELAASQKSEGEIADVLKISESTVRSHLARLLRKVGLSSRAEFMAYASENPETRTIQIGSADLLVSEFPRPPRELLMQLSPREQDVVAATLAGKTIRSIAEESGHSHRTVETQLVSAYRKLDVKDRAGLFRLMARAADD